MARSRRTGKVTPVTPLVPHRRQTVPGWLNHTLSLRPAPVPWHEVVRAALFLPGPLALGLALGDVRAALYGSLGTLLAVLAERAGTTGQRITRIAVAATGGVLSMVVGRHSGGTGPVPLLCVLAFALGSGVLSSIHPMLSFAGMQLLVQMSIAGGLRLGVPLWTLIPWYLGGVLWVIAGVALQGALERTAVRYREAVSDLPLLLGRRIGEGSRAPADVEIAMADTFALLAAAHPVRRRTRAEVRALSGALLRMPALLTAATAIARTGDVTARAALGRDLKSLSEAIRRPGSGGSDATTAFADIVTAPPAAPDRHLAWSIARALPRTLRSATTRNYVARVMICMGVAELVRQCAPTGRGYWILLTVALTLKPDFQPVLARTVQRAAGTVLGALLAAPLLLLVPAGWMSLPLLAILAGGIPYAVRRNYGLFSVVITPIILILLASVVPTGAPAIGQRITDTAIGCAIVIGCGYLLWPRTWLPPARDQIAVLLDDLAGWLTAGDEHAPERAALYRHLAELKTVADHAPFEPGPVRRRRHAWADTLTAVTEVAAASAVARRSRDGAVLAAAAVDVADLAGTLRRRRSPAPSGRPIEGTTSESDITVAVDGLRAAVRRGGW